MELTQSPTRSGAPSSGARRSRAQAHRQRVRRRHVRHGAALGLPPGLSHERDQLNQNTPIWMRKPEDVTNEEYASFYTFLYNEGANHLATKHFSIKGPLDIHALLFVPFRAPLESAKLPKHIQLYERSVFFTDSCDEFMPEWFHIVKGVIHSELLPQNIMCQTPQQNKIMRVIKKHLVKHCLELFAEITEKQDTYNKLYERLGQCLRLDVQQTRAEDETFINGVPCAPCTTNGPAPYKDIGAEPERRPEGSMKGIMGHYPETCPNSSTSDSKADVMLDPTFVKEYVPPKGMEVRPPTAPYEEYYARTLEELGGDSQSTVKRDGRAGCEHPRSTLAFLRETDILQVMACSNRQCAIGASALLFRV